MGGMEEWVTGESEHLRRQANLRCAKRKVTAERLKKKKRRKELASVMTLEVERKVSGLSALVKTVQIDGLNVTRDEVVEDILKEVLKAATYGEVIKAAKVAHDKLKASGCFKRVDGLLDVDDASTGTETPHLLAVRFRAEENLPLFGSLSTSTSENNELDCVLSVGSSNLLGRAERLEVRHSTGTGGSKRLRLHFTAPIVGIFKGDTNQTACFKAKAYGHQLSHSWSNLNVGELGATVGGTVSMFGWLRQHVYWKLLWRDLKPLAAAAAAGQGTGSSFSSDSSLAFAARKMCGHSLSSSLVHKLHFDTRDDAVLPTEGLKITLDQELCGLFGGDSCFLKSQGGFSCHFKANRFLSLLNDQVSMGLGIAAGLLSPMKTCSGRENDTISACDRFAMGGPLCMRGFQFNSTCVDEDDRGAFLGARAFWRSCLQLYFPLPYLRNKNAWVANNLKGHSFFECGTLANPLNRSFLSAAQEDWVFKDLRLSAGIGLVLRLGDRGRAELNYCVPIRAARGDRITNGPQFGIGFNFS